MADRLSDDLLREILDVERSMTTGPWEAQTSNSMRRIGSGDMDGNVLHAFKAVDGVPCVAVRDEDLDGIVLARNHLRALVEEVIGRTAEATALRGALETAERILWMAERYAEDGGTHGPEARDYREAVEDIDRGKRLAAEAARKDGGTKP